MNRWWRAAPAAVVLGATLCGPLLAPHRIDDPIVAPYASPGAAAPLGGDHLGRDVLSRLLAGGAELLAVAAVVAVIVTLLAGCSARSPRCVRRSAGSSSGARTC